jgi:hypothetical protein
MDQRTQTTVWNFFDSVPVKSLQDPTNIGQGKGAFVLKWMLDDLVKNALCHYGCMQVWCGLSVLLLQLVGDLVWTALCCYGCWEMWFGLLCAAMNVWKSAMDVARSG